MTADAPGRPFTVLAADVLAAAGGRLLNGDPARAVHGFSIDTRTLQAGDLYIAIRGDRYDGHAFVAGALQAGACGVVVSASPAVPAAGFGDRLLFAVEDTTRALQELARWIRRRSRATVVAITGSAGKTTTKEITATFLGLKRNVMRSGGNLNNHIGLPLSLLNLRHGADSAVVELGMNHAGEISRLVAIAEPDVRVWTNVAEVHTEFFPSLEAIADAKAEVLEGATASTRLVANADDPRIGARITRFPGRTVTFGFAGQADVTAAGVKDNGLEGTVSRLRTPAGEVEWRLPLPGRANLANALAAVAVGLEFGVSLEAMAEAAATLRPASHRGEVIRLAGGVTIVDDAYNSNPRALQGALGVVVADTTHRRRGAVLGEMLELGAQSVALHEACGAAAARAGLGFLLTVGGEPARALGRAAVAAGMPPDQVRHAATSEDAADMVAGLLRAGDLVLVKGSRGIRTERVLERIKGLFS